MPLYQVKWHHSRSDPRASHWWVLNGVVTAASEVLARGGWVGRKHKDLVRQLRGNSISLLSADQHIPPTVKYHQQLKSNADALLTLMETRMVKKPVQSIAK